MKKTLVFLASALFVALFAASCNNNNSTSSETDVIDELLEEAVVEEEPAEDKALTDGVWVNDDWGSKTTYQFSEDGICTVIRPDFDGGIDTIKWNYTLDGETMKLEQKGDNFSMSKEINVSINGNKLTITEAGVPMDYKWQAAE